MPISAATLPLPSGASTLAAQTQPGVDIGDVTINNAAGAAAVNIQDGGNSVTVDGSLTVTQATGTNLHVTVDNSPSITNDGTFATPARQDTGNASLASAVTTLNSILANQIVPLGGPQAIAQNAYWVTHRLDEQNVIENMKQAINNIISSESETSQRMGFELR